MGCWQHRQHGLFYKQFDPEAVTVAQGGPNKGDIDLTAVQSRNQPRHQALLGSQQHSGKPLAIGADDAGYHGLEISGAGETDPHAAGLAASAALHRGFGMFHMIEDPARFLEQQSPTVGQLHATRQAAEQRRAQLPLELSNLLTERRLLHSKPLSRAGEVQLLGDSYEIAKMTKIHLKCLAGTAPILFGSFRPRHGGAWHGQRRPSPCAGE
jgi:hypothetical protein